MVLKCIFCTLKNNPRENVLGRSEYASESGRRPPCSLWRTKKRYGFGPGGGYKKREVRKPPFLVPRAGVEPARVAPLVFETSASTDSAIWAGKNRREGTTFC